MMKSAVIESQAKTFGDWAYLAIEKHFKKILKHEVAVLQDKDPEELHQMRVGMRRLRSAMVGFSLAVDLPSSSNQKQIGSIAKVLGKLRDLDVMGEVLTQEHFAQLPSQEQEQLALALNTLAKRRKRALKAVRGVLSNKPYLKFKQSLQDWLEKPSYTAIAGIAIEMVLPDLLIPQLSRLLLHPGWLVGVTLNRGEIVFPEALSSRQVDSLLENKGTLLHDLRKEAKRSRYNLELFSRFYDEDYQSQIKSIKSVQTVLGNIQDSFVLVDFLSSCLTSNFSKKLSVFSKNMVDIRYQQWKVWEKSQRQLLNHQTRKDFYSTILTEGVTERLKSMLYKT